MIPPVLPKGKPPRGRPDPSAAGQRKDLLPKRRTAAGENCGAKCPPGLCDRVTPKSKALRFHETLPNVKKDAGFMKCFSTHFGKRGAPGAGGRQDRHRTSRVQGCYCIGLVSTCKKQKKKSHSGSILLLILGLRALVLLLRFPSAMVLRPSPCPCCRRFSCCLLGPCSPCLVPG